MAHRMEGSRRGHHTKVEHPVETCEHRGRLWTEARLGWWRAQHEILVDRQETCQRPTLFRYNTEGPATSNGALKLIALELSTFTSSVTIVSRLLTLYHSTA